MNKELTTNVEHSPIYVIMQHKPYGYSKVCGGYYTDKQKAQKKCNEYISIMDSEFLFWVEELSHTSTYIED